MAKKVGNIVLEGAKILFRNFKGEAKQYNAAGDRNFCVLIDHDLAERLKVDGWAVKYLRPREEGDDPQPYLKVKVNYSNIPPKVWLIAGRGKTLMNENTVECLDYAEIESVDLTISPYAWEMPGGRTGITAYLKNMYVTIVKDEFESKYYDIPDTDVKVEIPFD